MSIEWKENDAIPGLLAFSADGVTCYSIYQQRTEHQLRVNNSIAKTGTLDDCKCFAENIEANIPPAKPRKTARVTVEDDMSLTPEERRKKQ